MILKCAEFVATEAAIMRSLYMHAKVKKVATFSMMVSFWILWVQFCSLLTTCSPETRDSHDTLCRRAPTCFYGCHLRRSLSMVVADFYLRHAYSAVHVVYRLPFRFFVSSLQMTLQHWRQYEHVTSSEPERTCSGNFRNIPPLVGGFRTKIYQCALTYLR